MTANKETNVTARSTRRPPKRWGTIPEAVALSARSRTRLYELAGRHVGLFRRDGRKVIVDLFMLDELNEQLPAAEIKQAG